MVMIVKETITLLVSKERLGCCSKQIIVVVCNIGIGVSNV